MSSTTGTERPHRSVSQLTSWAGCGERYRLERLARVPQRPAAWSIGGTAIHAGIEAWEKSGRMMSPAEAEDIVVTEYRERVNKLLDTWELTHWMTGGRKKADNDLTDREEKAVFQLIDYISWARSQEHLWSVEASEVEFKIELGGVPVLGYIDQIIRWTDGRVSVRDLKSGTSAPSSCVQLGVYAIAATQLYGHPVTGGEFAVLGNPNGRKAESQTVRLIEYDLEQEAAASPEFLAQFFRDADRGITEEIFIPAPNDSCERTCAVSQWCRAKGVKSSAEQKQKGIIPITPISN